MDSREDNARIKTCNPWRVTIGEAFVHMPWCITLTGLDGFVEGHREQGRYQAVNITQQRIRTRG